MVLESSMWTYFAYGSNLWVPRLQARTPSAKVKAIGTLASHDLRFHKRGDDGSGKCDAFFTQNPKHLIWGVVYQLNTNEKKILDEIEGVGNGYELKQITVATSTRDIQAWTYVVQQGFINPAIKPFDWYHGFVLKGATAHQFPATYLQKIREQETVIDPNAARRHRNTEILNTLA